MISDIDIWRCAAVMIRNYGDTAGMEAVMRADEYAVRQEPGGQQVWLRIARAIDEMRNVKPGEAKN